MQSKSTFLKSIITLVTGNTIALIIPIALYPFLSRTFSPEDYSLFGIYISLFSLLDIASVGRYDFALILPQHDDDAINILAGGLAISLAYSLFILLLVCLFGNWTATKLNNVRLANWLFILPSGLLLSSVSKLFNSWLIRKKQFKASSFNKASQKLGETSSQILFGFFKVGNGLVLGDIFGRGLSAIAAFYQSMKADFDKDAISEREVKRLLLKYIEFPKLNIFPSMLNTLAGMIPVFVISSYYSIEISGSFNFSRIMLSVPFALIATSISQVLMQQISERQHRKLSILKDLSSLATKLFFLSIFGVIILSLLAPDIFEIVFGGKWRQSGEFTRILIFSTGISFIVSPFSVLLVILGKLKYLGIWQIFYFVANCAILVFRHLPVEKTLFLIVVVDTVSYFIYGLLIYFAVKNYENTLSQVQ